MSDEISKIVSFTLLIIIYPLVLYLFFMINQLSKKIEEIENEIIYISKIINQNNTILETKINT